MLLNALEIFSPKYVLCAMDVGKPTFRHVIYSEYKGTRGPADLSLIDQFPLVEEILKSFNIPVLKKEGMKQMISLVLFLDMYRRVYGKMRI